MFVGIEILIPLFERKIVPLTLGEVRELIQPSSGAAAAPEVDLGIRIVVLQRGWVVIGWLYQLGSQMRLCGASVIRRWGTTRGLGQLAAEGPTENTTLDRSPEIRFHELTVVLSIVCDEAIWSDKCKLQN